MDRMPGSLIFVCTKNAIRSPMAESMTKHMMAQGEIPLAYVDSAGVDPGDIDGFVIAAMSELDIDIQRHESKSMKALASGEFDLIIALSNTAAAQAEELVQGFDSTVELWHMDDPSIVEGNREARMDAYRAVRDTLAAKIRQRFPL